MVAEFWPSRPTSFKHVLLRSVLRSNLTTHHSSTDIRIRTNNQIRPAYHSRKHGSKVDQGRNPSPPKTLSQFNSLGVPKRKEKEKKNEASRILNPRYSNMEMVLQLLVNWIDTKLLIQRPWSWTPIGQATEVKPPGRWGWIAASLPGKHSKQQQQQGAG